jgi:hypothetical protein
MDRKSNLKTINKIINSDFKNRKAQLNSFVYNGDLDKKFLHNPRAVQNSHQSHFTQIDHDKIQVKVQEKMHKL